MGTGQSAMGNRQSAFTLIELLIVMAVITVVVALGIPLFGALTGAKKPGAQQKMTIATPRRRHSMALLPRLICGPRGPGPAGFFLSLARKILGGPPSRTRGLGFEPCGAGERARQGAGSFARLRRADRGIGQEGVHGVP